MQRIANPSRGHTRAGVRVPLPPPIICSFARLAVRLGYIPMTAHRRCMCRNLKNFTEPKWLKRSSRDPIPGATQFFQLGIIISPIDAYLDERFWFV